MTEQISLDGSKVEIKASCKRCYFHSSYVGCLSCLEHDVENPEKCKGFILVQEKEYDELCNQGWGSALVKRLGYWEWQDDS